MIFQDRIDRIFASRKFNLIAFVLIAALILIAYSNTFTASFHFDDNPSIVENAGIKRMNWDNFMAAFSGTRPIVNQSLLFNYYFSGLNVVGWHIFNISVHIANSFFVYLLALWTFSLPSLRERFGDRAKRMALFAALLFGVHPIQTEAVTYIISRTELIATFFYLAAFLFFIKGATKRKFGYYLWAFFAALLAMGSKEWAVTLPAVLLLYDYLFLSEGRLQSLLSRLHAHLLVILSCSWLIYNMSTTKMNGAGFSVVGQNNITAWSYLLTSFNVMWTYIRLLILPINQNLDYDYAWSRTLFEFPTLLSLLGHIAVVAVCIILFRRRKMTVIPFGAAWFYITLSPTQSFVPILDVIFEHRLYLPSIGFFLIFVAAFEGVFDWIESRKKPALQVAAG
jgi:protein O-mannosyl-transferase